MHNTGHCLICGNEWTPQSHVPATDVTEYKCLTCGPYRVTGTAESTLGQGRDWSERQRAVLSHAVRRMNSGSGPPLLNVEEVERILKEDYLPSAFDQMNILTLWLGDAVPGPGQYARLQTRDMRGVLGAIDGHGAEFILNALESEGICSIRNGYVDSGPSRHADVRLTVTGWREYERLLRGRSQGLAAFMAMPFQDAEVNAAYEGAFKPGAQRAGFNLARLDENPAAGLIDTRMRNDIRISRFLVADLTNGNPGAYWEAGFAEGLGKPVIYTCETSYFATQRTHFDTNHCHTVLWNSASLADAATALTETIRNTLPEDARLQDAPD